MGGGGGEGVCRKGGHADDANLDFKLNTREGPDVVPSVGTNIGDRSIDVARPREFHKMVEIPTAENKIEVAADEEEMAGAWRKKIALDLC